MATNKSVQCDGEPSTKKRTVMTRVILGLLVLAAVLSMAVMPVSASYTPAYTPIAFGCVTAQIPDQIAISGDVFVQTLNIVVSNWLTMMEIVLSIFLVAWGCVTSLFRRGKRRGR